MRLVWVIAAAVCALLGLEPARRGWLVLAVVCALLALLGCVAPTADRFRPVTVTIAPAACPAGTPASRLTIARAPDTTVTHLVPAADLPARLAALQAQDPTAPILIAPTRCP